MRKVQSDGLLGSLGVDVQAERVYRLVLELPSAGMAELARKLGLEENRLSEVLRRLTDLRLLRPTESSPLGLTPVAPRAALVGLVHRRQAELELARAGIEELAERFGRRRAVAATPAVVEVVTGRTSIRHRAEELGDSAEQEILVFDTPPYAGDLSTAEIGREAGQLARGVIILSLYSQESLELAGRVERVLPLIGLGEQARVLPTLPLKLHIYDRSVAIVPMASTEDAAESVAIVHRSGLLDGLVALFEALWERAQPLGGVELPPGRNGDLALLTLMAAGLKDDSIARQLGVNVRTARRHIADLTERLESTSRFQAGVEAHRRGWVT